MKILHLTKNYDKGGTGISVKRLHELLISKGISSTIYNEQVTLGPAVTIPLTRFQRILRKLTTRLSKYLVRWIIGINSNYFTTGLFPSSWCKILNNSEASIVHLHTMGSEILSLRQIQKINKPIVLTLHDHWFLNNGYHIKHSNEFSEGTLATMFRRYISRLRKSCLNHKKITLIAPSNFIANEVRFDPIMSQFPLEVIPHPYSASMDFVQDKNKSRLMLGLNPKKKYILFAADPRSDPNKGFDRLINVLTAAEFRPYCQQIELIILTTELPKSYQKFDIPVNCLGQISSQLMMTTIMKASDLLAMPSLYESFGLVAQEATQLGLPVICSRGLGMDDIVTDGINGKLVDFDQKKNTVRCLINLLEHPLELERSKTSIEEQNALIFMKYINVYKKLI